MVQQKDLTIEHKTREQLVQDLTRANTCIAEMAREIAELKTRCGESRSIDFILSPLMDTDGQVECLIPSATDIPERKEAEEALRESEARYRAIVEAFDGFIYICSQDYRVEFMNKHLIERTGYDGTGQLCYKALHDLDSTCPWCVNKQVFAGKTVRWEVQSPKDNHWYYVVNTPIHHADGSISKQAMILDITERKRMEEAIRASEAQMRALFAAMTDVVLVSNSEGRYLKIIDTNTSRKLTNELVGKTLHDVFPKQQADFFLDQLKQALRTQRPVNFEYRLLVEDKQFWFNATASPMSDEKILTVARDITQRIQDEEALRQRSEEIQRLIEAVPVAVWVAQDAQCTVIRGNKLANQFYEAQGGENVSASAVPELRRFFTPDGHELRAEELPMQKAAAINNNVRNSEIHVQLPSGRRIAMLGSAVPLRDEAGNVRGCIGAFLDITERRQADERQRIIKERFELLSNISERLLCSENPQLIVEELCQLVMAHLQCQLFFNYLVEVPDQQMRLNAFAGISEEAAVLIQQLDFGVAICGCVAREGQPLIVGQIQSSKDSRTELVKSYGVQAYCCHPLLAQGQLIGTLSFGTRTRPQFTPDEVELMKTVSDQVAIAMQRLRSETSLRQMNETLEQRVAQRTELSEARAQQLQALTIELIEAEERERREFAHLLHEDLQQMLAAAKMQIQAVAETLPSELLLAGAVKLLEESITKTRRLSHELSPAVLYQSGLVAALKWLAAQMQEQFGLRIEISADMPEQLTSTPVTVFLFRAARELFFNVVKHAGVKTAKVILITSNDMAVLSVSDPGCGFDSQSIDNGVIKTGFGLMSIRERASYIGGSLTIESAPGKGSRLTLCVPHKAPVNTLETSFEQPAGQQHAATEQSSVIRTVGETRVMFVDDHKVMRQGLIQLVASQPNIKVVGEAANGREALNLARLIQPDVIIMDVSMPEMNGIEATRRIKAEMPQIRIIGLSMHDDAQITRDMLEAGAETMVSKTASAAEIIKVIYGTAEKMNFR
jgi:PAS domain S-box-containing protein